MRRRKAPGRKPRGGVWNETSCLRFQSWKERYAGAQQVPVRQAAPRGVAQSKRPVPGELLGNSLRGTRQDGREKNGDDSQRVGEMVEDRVEAGGLGRVFREHPRLLVLNELIAVAGQ